MIQKALKVQGKEVLQSNIGSFMYKEFWPRWCPLHWHNTEIVVLRPLLASDFNLNRLSHNPNFYDLEVAGPLKTFSVDLLRFNSLPNDKFPDWSKPKAFADDKKNATLQQMFISGCIENIGGKGENAGRKHCGKRRKCWLPVSVHVCADWYIENTYIVLSYIKNI